MMDKETFKYITESDHPKHKLTIKNIKVFSVSKDLFTAFNEWHVQHPLPNPDELDTTITHCEFCGTKIAYAFPVTNIETKNTRIIGAKCLTYYSLNYQDGKLLTPKEAEKLHNKKIQEIKEYRKNPWEYEVLLKYNHKYKHEIREQKMWGNIEAVFKKEQQQQCYANDLLQLGKNRESWEEMYYYLKKTHGEEYKKEVAQIAKELFYKKK
jgi:hypothetical protein